MSVLIAHTDVGVRDLARRALGPLGHEVLLAEDAGAALRLLRAAAPDVAVLQDSLCGRDGVAMLDCVKRDLDLFRTAVVVARPADSVEAVQDLLRRGAQDVLREPIEAPELVARVRSAQRMKVLQEELDAQSRRIEGLVYGDDLTGLSNRRFLFAQLSALVSGARRHGRPMSVAMVDVDHFKAVNDRHGHAVGDVVLARVARVMAESLRQEDWLGRMGGEEFCALLPDEDAAGATVAAERLRRAVEAAEVRSHELVLHVTVSVGWATLDPEEGGDELLRRADEALYAAKAAGRNAVRGAATLRRRT